MDAPGAPVLAGLGPAGTGGLALAARSCSCGRAAWGSCARGWRGAPACAAARPRAARGRRSGALLVLVALAVWLANPYAAGVLLPAAHAWLFLASPGTRLRGWAAAVALRGRAVLPLLLGFHYARALGEDPLELLWSGFLAVAGGPSRSGGAGALALGGLLRGAPLRSCARAGASRHAPAGAHPHARAGHLRRSRFPGRHRVGAAT